MPGNDGHRTGPLSAPDSVRVPLSPGSPCRERLLDDLKDNGGATKTIALRLGSPAIDKANPDTAPARDQRGVLRHDPDIGAFERR